MHKIIFFPENLKKKSRFDRFTSKFRLGWVTLNTGIFIWPYPDDRYWFQIQSMDIFQKYGMSNSNGGNIVTSQDCFDSTLGKFEYIGGI